MILADTSVWVDHLRRRDGKLAELLEAGQVLQHPFVIGEVALGHLRQRDMVIAALQDLPAASVATDQEVLQFIDDNALHGVGIGYLDAHLLAAVRLTTGSELWTRDKPLRRVAERLGVAAAMK